MVRRRNRLGATLRDALLARAPMAMDEMVVMLFHGEILRTRYSRLSELVVFLIVSPTLTGSFSVAQKERVLKRTENG